MAFKSISPASSIWRENLKSVFPFFVEIELARKMDLKTIPKYWFWWSGGHTRAHTRTQKNERTGMSENNDPNKNNQKSLFCYGV